MRKRGILALALALVMLWCGATPAYAAAAAASGHLSYGYFQKYGDYLYYDYDMCLYRMSLDGSRKTKILNENVAGDSEQFVIENDVVYYVDSESGALCRIGLNGTGKQKLTTQKVGSLSVYDHCVYYVVGTLDGPLYFYDPVTGANEGFAPISGDVSFYRIAGDTIFYSQTPFIESNSPSDWWINADSELESMKMDGTDRRDYGYIRSREYGFLVQDGMLYTVCSQDHTLSACNLDALESANLANGVYQIFGIAGGSVFASGTGDAMFRVSLANGTKYLAPAMKYSCPNFRIYGPYIYASQTNLGGGFDLSVNTVDGISRFDLNGNLVGRLTASIQNGEPYDG